MTPRTTSLQTVSSNDRTDLSELSRQRDGNHMKKEWSNE